MMLNRDVGGLVVHRVSLHFCIKLLHNLYPEHLFEAYPLHLFQLMAENTRVIAHFAENVITLKHLSICFSFPHVPFYRLNILYLFQKCGTIVVFPAMV